MVLRFTPSSSKPISGFASILANLGARADGESRCGDDLLTIEGSDLLPGCSKFHLAIADYIGGHSLLDREINELLRKSPAP